MALPSLQDTLIDSGSASDIGFGLHPFVTFIPTVRIFDTMSGCCQLPAALFYFSLLFVSSTAFSTQTRPLAPPVKKASLGAVLRQDAYWDGAEWQSLRRCLKAEQTIPKSSQGSLSLVIGDNEGDRVIAVEVSGDAGERSTSTIEGSKTVYRDSIAKVPSGVSDAQAMALYSEGVLWHCAMPSSLVVSGIGGEQEASFAADKTKGRVVVLGGHERAVRTAQAMAILGADVFVVSTNSPNDRKFQQLTKAHSNAKVLEPEVGDDAVGFASVIGNFDVMVDTLDDEFNGRESNEDIFLQSTVLRLLSQRHDCSKYISSMCLAQKIIADSGVLFGPGKAKAHVRSVPTLKSQTFAPPMHLGTTMEKILDQAGSFGGFKVDLKSPIVRGWTMPEFMEATMWPRDTNGVASVRYGMPVIEEVFLDKYEDEDMIAEPPTTTKYWGEQTQLSSEPTDSQEAEEDEEIEREEAAQTDSYVLELVGVEGVRKHILQSESNCLLFLSAPFCKTCKALGPRYQRMARNAKIEGGDSSILFAKANASGPVGKELGRKLGVSAVPTFVLFAKGQRYGKPLGITRLPSPKLELALQYLQEGKAWDDEVFKENESKKPTGKKKQ